MPSDIADMKHEIFSLGYFIAGPVLDDLQEQGLIDEEARKELEANNAETVKRLEEY